MYIQCNGARAITNMGMIGYAMNHAEENERSEGIATLEKREDINDHLISETE